MNITQSIRIAVLSDTHGLWRDEVPQRLAGVDRILHAGDVGEAKAGSPAILDRLRAIAPVTAIRGNIDRSEPTASLPATEVVELGGCLIYMLHNLEDLDLKPSAAGVHVVVFGHTHHPKTYTQDGVLYLNPGSIGPRRFQLPIGYAELTIATGIPTPKLYTLS